MEEIIEIDIGPLQLLQGWQAGGVHTLAESCLGVVQLHGEVVALCAYCILGELEYSLVISNIGDEVHSSDGDVGLGLEGGGGEVGAADLAFVGHLHPHYPSC